MKKNKNNKSAEKKRPTQSDNTGAESCNKKFEENQIGENKVVSDALDSASSVNSSDAGVIEPAQAENTTKKQSFSRKMLGNIWDGLIARQFFQKVFTLLFAVSVFGAVYFYMSAHRSILTYLGVMLLMVIVYVEILVIRDHLWVIEGSMRESRKWRDIFFNETSLRKQRIRKIIIMLFALGIFSYVYMKTSAISAPVLSFLGIVLLITVLYYEILTIRDDVFVLMQSIQKQPEEDLSNREQQYEKFIAKKEDKGSHGQVEK